MGILIAIENVCPEKIEELGKLPTEKVRELLYFNMKKLRISNQRINKRTRIVELLREILFIRYMDKRDQVTVVKRK